MSAAAIGQMLGSLVAVIGLIFLLAWASKRLPLAHAGKAGWLKVHTSVAVGGRERVVLVQAGQDWLVLGVSPGRVETLHVLERPPEDFSDLLSEEKTS